MTWCIGCCDAPGVHFDRDGYARCDACHARRERRQARLRRRHQQVLREAKRDFAAWDGTAARRERQLPRLRVGKAWDAYD